MCFRGCPQIFSYHSRGLSGHLDGVSPVGDGHLTLVHDVQAGIQDSIVKLGQKNILKAKKIIWKTSPEVLHLSLYYLSIVPVSLSDVVVCTVVDDAHLRHHTLLPLFLVIQIHSIS